MSDAKKAELQRQVDLSKNVGNFPPRAGTPVLQTTELVTVGKPPMTATKAFLLVGGLALAGFIAWKIYKKAR